jgi:energy-coupling factor transport system permease protein
MIYSILGILTLYMILQGYVGSAMKIGSVALLAILLKYMSSGQGLTVLMPDMFLFIITRIMLMLMAAHPLMGMPTGEAVAVFKKMHVPDVFALPVTFMLRFLPTVRNEFANVFAALHLRGLLSPRHPLRAIEYIIVPVMIRASRISEELAASAETRGIAFPGEHTSRREIVFRRHDFWLCFIGIIVTIGMLVWEGACIT